MGLTRILSLLRPNTQQLAYSVAEFHWNLVEFLLSSQGPVPASYDHWISLPIKDLTAKRSSGGQVGPGIDGYEQNRAR